MVPPLLEAGAHIRSIHAYDAGKEYFIFSDVGYKELSLKPVNLVHDVPNCGYKIEIDDQRLFYATDTATLDGIEAKDYDLYLIEANHTKAEIEVRIAEKQARGEFTYETRAARNHLSREQSEEWLARNAGPNSYYVFLHGHKDKEVSRHKEESEGCP